MEWWERTPAILAGDYEKIYGINDEITQAEVNFLMDETALPPHTKLLDLACGTGRHSIQLARLGYDVTGLDISPEFLKFAAERAKDAGLSINWVQQDMRQIPFENAFDLIFIMFGAWGFFVEDVENYAVLERVHQALKADGHFILDFFNRDWILSHFQSVYVEEREIGYFIENRSFDYQQERLNTEVILVKEDKSILTWETSIRAFILPEIENMLQQAGFNLVGVYGNLEKQAYTLNTPRLLLHAQK
jgi:SAM-dependent methyltransferase